MDRKLDAIIKVQQAASQYETLKELRGTAAELLRLAGKAFAGCEGDKYANALRALAMSFSARAEKARMSYENHYRGRGREGEVYLRGLIEPPAPEAEEEGDA